MDKHQISSNSKKSASDKNKYIFLGYTLQLPITENLFSIAIENKRFRATTDQRILTLKACTRCKRLRELDDFYGGKSHCRGCHKFIVKQWEKRNPEKVKMYKTISNKRYNYKQKLKSVGLE